MVRDALKILVSYRSLLCKMTLRSYSRRELSRDWNFMAHLVFGYFDSEHVQDRANSDEESVIRHISSRADSNPRAQHERYEFTQAYDHQPSPESEGW